MQRRIIPKEIKEEILSKVRSGEKVASTAEQYGVSTKSIYTWLSKEAGEELVSPLKYNKLKRENEELKRLIGELTLDMSQGKKIELVRAGSIKSVRADALRINRKNIYRESKIEKRDRLLVEDIRNVHKENPAYGHKRVAWELGINHKRASQVMKKYGIKPPRRKTVRKWTTVSTDNHDYTNLIKGIIPDKPDFIFVSDLTYIKYQGKFIYMAGVEDIFTRELVSAGIGTKHNSALAPSTVKMAISKTVPEIFHSDQGTEFMARTTTDYLEEKGVEISVSDKASPWQNGYKESFFGRFKDEFGDPNRFGTLGELIAAIYQHINYYNNRRIHTALKMPPAIFRQKVSDNCLPKRGT